MWYALFVTKIKKGSDQMKELAIFLDSNIKSPVYEQIYNSIKKEITKGALPPGEKLPSSRKLSEQLQCSRSTILMAYDQLLAEGYIETKPKSGYFVAELFMDFIKQEVKSVKIEDGNPDKGYEIDFSPAGIDTDNFPYNEWRKLSRQVLNSDNIELFNSGDRRGDFGLRSAIAEYLNAFRGVKANPDRIILGAGYESLLMLLDSILGKDAVFAMENPAYPKAYRLIKSFGRQVCPVGLDDKGINISELNKTSADVVYVTPSHQYPMGIVMPIKRRQELLVWSSSKDGRYIIEDDYDSEFRYKGKPIPSLQGMDSGDTVIYIGTFSKSISPAIRMSYMVLPEGLYEKYFENGKFYSNTVSRIDQKIVELFIKEGGFERHLSRMRTTYKNKHAGMLNRLKCWQNVEVSGENSGAHMLLWFKDGQKATDLIKKARRNRVNVYSLKDCCITNENLMEYENVVVLGYAKLNEKEIEKGLDILEKSWNIKC